MGRSRLPLGRCECSGPPTRTYDFDFDTVTVAHAKLVKEVSRGTPSPWFFQQSQTGPEKFTIKTRTIPFVGVWRVIEVAWEAVITETDACRTAAWEGGPSLGMEGLGSPFCVWDFVAYRMSHIKIKSKKEIEIQRSGIIIEQIIERQTEISIGASASVGPITLGGAKLGITWDPVVVSSTTVFSSPDNTPPEVVSELDK